jgi:uncharacterized protein (DUF2062 family)
VVFKRRDRRRPWQVAREMVYPRGGWKRALYYVTHRIRRLPDTPHKIARGIWAGVFISFSPFFGLHFVGAALIAWALRGNILASAIGTFFGNPLTYVPIGVISLQTGHFLLGRTFDESQHGTFLDGFAAAARDLNDNFMALFSGREAHWDGLAVFWHEIFFPYLIGGILPGIVAATACYYVTIPLVSAYQHRRKGRLKEKLAEIRAKAAAKKKHDAVE